MTMHTLHIYYQNTATICALTTRPIYKSCQKSSKVMGETKLSSVTFTLCYRQKIIQHSPIAWSAFSNTASMIRTIPLLNTWKPMHPNNEQFIGLMSTLHAQENCPREFFSSNRTHEVANFLNITLSRDTIQRMTPATVFVETLCSQIFIMNKFEISFLNGV